LMEYCTHAIESNQIPIPCPDDECDGIMHESTVRRVLLSSAKEEEQTKSADAFTKVQSLAWSTLGSIAGASAGAAAGDHNNNQQQVELWDKFHRLHRLSQDPDLIPCTKCQNLCSKKRDRLRHLQNIDSTSHNQLQCPDCPHSFCAIHGDAHPHITCEQSNRARKTRQQRKSEKLIRKFTKPCSHCRAPIHKEAGCDHIICPSCNNDFCFKCGSHEHLTGTSVRSCSKCKQSYLDHRYMWTHRMYVLCSVPLYIPFCVIHILVMSILALGTVGCCCCLFCGLRKESVGDDNDDNDDKNHDNGRNKMTTTTTTTVPSPPSPTHTVVTTASSLSTATVNKTAQQRRRTRIRCHPVQAIRSVLRMVFYPLIELADMCNVPCFLAEPEIIPTQTMEMDFGSDDDDDKVNVMNGTNAIADAV